MSRVAPRLLVAGREHAVPVMVVVHGKHDVLGGKSMAAGAAIQPARSVDVATNSSKLKPRVAASDCQKGRWAHLKFKGRRMQTMVCLAT